MVFLEPSVKQRLRRKRPSEKLLWRRNSAWPARHKPPTDCGQRPRNGRHDLLVKLTWMHYAKFIINRRWINRCVCRETARLQFRLPDGSSMTETFPSSSSLLTAVDVVRLASSLFVFYLRSKYVGFQWQSRNTDFGFRMSYFRNTCTCFYQDSFIVLDSHR